MRTLFKLFPLLSALSAFAGTATIFTDNQSRPFASGAGTVNFNSYNASSLTITVVTSAYGGSQQGGGRNYSGYAEAVIGGSNENQSIPNGSDPMSVSATNTLTVTKGGDGNWYSGGTNRGTNVSVSAYVTVDGEDIQGGATAFCTVNWVEAPTNTAPSIVWTASPGAVASGQTYTIAAHGHDADDNLALVRIWKNGVLLTSAGGGDGSDSDASDSTSDSGPLSVTFTAQATDTAGATSALITQTVTVAAPPPSVVTAAVSASPSVLTAPGSTTVAWSSAHATAVVVTGSGLNSTTPSGNQIVSGLAAGTHTFTITAQGQGGPVTDTASVTVNPAVVVSATISASPTTVTAPGSATITWSSVQATSVTVSGSGLNSAAASGSQTVSNLPPGSYDYTITAQGPNGPATQTATVTVSPAPIVAGSISASPTTGLAPGSTTLTWATSSASSVTVSGPGLSSTATTGSQTVTGLAAGTHTFTLTAQGPGGPITRTATYTVTAAAAVSGTITVSPTTTTAPGTATVTWSTANATSVVVSGPGVSNGAASGSATVTGLSAGSHTFTLTAQGLGGPITQTATVTVSAAATVSGSIAANPTTTTAPGTTTLTWSTVNATSAFVSGPGLASAALSGTQTVSGLPVGSHTFTLTIQGNGGPVSRTATVTVTPDAGLTAAISVSPGTINMGGIATLSWSTANASSVRVTGFGISGTSYQTNPNFTVNIGGLLPGQSTWTLLAEGPGGPVTRTAIINVNSTDGLYGSLTVNPTVMYSNQSATLAWTSSGTNFKWVHGYRPGNNGVFVYPAPVSGSTTVSGLAPGDYSFVFEYGPGSLSSTRSAYAYLTVLGLNRNIATTVAPVGAGAVTGAGTYREASSVTLTATPDSAHVFSGWSGDLTGAANPLTFTVGSRDYAVVANFAPRTYSVAVAVAPPGAGWVTGAGSYSAGSTAALTASADATHSFTGWTGDLTSVANPLSFAVNGGVNLTANFATTGFTLTTAASSGGTVTPGGVYPAGTVVTLTATPDALYRFAAWSGDAAGTTTTMAVTVDRPKFVQANFTGKTAQTISFAPPGDHAITAPPFALSASASSGLPVSFSLLGGPAILTGNIVEVTGAGPVTLRADQSGDEFFQPAPPVSQTFNVLVAATLKYRGQSRTLLRDATSREAPPYVLEKP